MTSLTPFLTVRLPGKEEYSVNLEKDEILIGRLKASNDISLEPDPEMLVGRTHCFLQKSMDRWWVVDNGSTNGTFVFREGSTVRVTGREPLANDDIIRILGRLTDAPEPVYWELTFHDPFGTKRAVAWRSGGEYLEYDWVQARLLRIDDVESREVQISALEHKLIRYMDNRNRSNSNVPVMCEFEELIKAVWGTDSDKLPVRADVNGLVFALRKKIEPKPETPIFLENVRGLGYRLVTRLAQDR